MIFKRNLYSEFTEKLYIHKNISIIILKKYYHEFLQRPLNENIFILTKKLSLYINTKRRLIYDELYTAPQKTVNPAAFFFSVDFPKESRIR